MAYDIVLTADTIQPLRLLGEALPTYDSKLHNWDIITFDDGAGNSYRIRRWKVIKRHPDFENGWIIESGTCRRLIFPLDFHYYYLKN